MININRLNQNNEYSLDKPNIAKQYSTLITRENNQSTGNVGRIIPFYWHEVLPSERHNANTAINIEFTPWITNIIHEIQADVLYYFVPYRIIWDDWKKFITRCDEDNDDTSGTLEIPLPNYTAFEIIKEGIKAKNVRNYNTTELPKKLLVEEETISINVTIGQGSGNITFVPSVVEKWYTKYKTIYPNSQYTYDKFWHFLVRIWEYVMKDTELQSTLEVPPEMVITTTDTIENVLTKTEKFNYIWQDVLTHTIYDYAGLPTNFNGFAFIIDKLYSEGFSISNWDGMVNKIATEEWKEIASSYYINKLNFWAYNKIFNDWTRLLDWESKIDKNSIKTLIGNKNWDIFTRARRYSMRGAEPTIPVDVTQIGTDGGEWKTTELLGASALMNYFVANAKIKPRYAEQLLARWGVQIQDSRFQYAQLIGNGTIYITQDGVTQTAPQVGDSTIQGNITGQGWGNGSAGTDFYAPEHGVIIGLMQIKPANSYELGINPLWQKKDTFDFATPEFINLPDRQIKGIELAYTERSAPRNKIIGYKSIYDEYRTKVNRVTGLLRPSQEAGLKAHTLALSYKDTMENSDLPTMEYITRCNFPMKRIKQFIDQPDFLFISTTNIKMTLPLPYQNDVRIKI
ncbi:MAG: hypothetical protein IJH65_16900 [Methanobrevibacter sp.]|nr:hypothetical protein [Methanobrevibacter sp.]